MPARYPTHAEAQITRLKAESSRLKERLAKTEQVNSDLVDFREEAKGELAAQHEETVRLRDASTAGTRFTQLPAPQTTVSGTCS